LTQNSFPMREWHIEHMKKTIEKYIVGLSESATKYQKRLHKKYGTLTSVCRQINYDVKHGVTNEQVLLLLQTIRNDSYYSSILKDNSGSMERLDEIEKHFLPPEQETRRYSYQRTI
jgi:hypothetical protein